MDQIKELVDAVSDRLSAVADSNVVAGTPIELGSVTVVPISRISLGIGAGGGEGEGTGGGKGGAKAFKGKGKGTGGGSGGAGKIRPVAVAVISDDGVEILAIGEKKGKLDRLLDKIPDLVDRLKEAS